MQGVEDPGTLVEALKHLKLLEKRVESNRNRIRKYAAQPANEKPHFRDEEEQIQEVKSLVQANIDLVHEILTIKSRIDFTNSLTTVEISGKGYTISNLLVLKRIGSLITGTYQDLDDSSARREAKGFIASPDDDAGFFRSSRPKKSPSQSEQPVNITRYFDEREKFEKLQEWENFLGQIDARLEVANATTTLLVQQ